ncbi:restriction endonuclease subunit S [Megasphaera stantonii]|uniref:restriction endonuclease subunit S n=1 Tax=Megasphaera stantonii TaxID=2144175 RepID=UPI0032082358
MTPQELKNSILQFAIQGKLVEQRPEEGPAEELFVQIQKEKQRLVKEGKIKKEKPLPEISEEEKPFKIPKSWMWVRVGALFQHNTGKALNSINRTGKCLKYITTSNLYWNRFELNQLKEMFFTDSEIEKCTVKKGDLLVCEGGDIGRAAIWQSDEDIRIQNHIHRLRPYYPICVKFFYYLFFLYKQAGLIGGKGIGIKGLSSKAIHVLVFPLPPLAEQKRIVVKIEELLPYIDSYEQAWNKLEQLNKRFPGDMKKSLLQYAIQGKLVEQRPEEGTAEELFAQIQEEKQRLVKEGKIKKEKPLPEITEKEKPFEIPDSWMWVRVGALFQHNTGKALNSINRTGKCLKYITTSNLYWNRFELNQLKEMFFTDSEIEKCTVKKGDLLVCEGGDIGRAAIWQSDKDIRIQNHIHRLRPYYPICVKFFYYLFFLYKQTGLIGGKGIGIKGLSSKAIHVLVFPLPPLAEQKRIVAKLEQLLPLCERLKR